MEDGHQSSFADPASPEAGLLIDIGRQGRKRIRRLKRGEGKLARQVQAAVYQAEKGRGDTHPREIVPVVLLYRCIDTEYALVTRRVKDAR
jgi:hypothetical protein